MFRWPARQRLSSRRRPSPRGWITAIATLVVFTALFTANTAADPSNRVGKIRIDGAITPVMATYVGRGIERAAERGDHAIIIEMDTPGGLSSAMDDIVGDILNAPIPVIVWVAPDGARAASAGVYITYAAHVAAMAPATNIGSATPVQIGGEGETSGTPTTMDRKVVNDAVAKIRALAERRGRNADWAEKAVRDAANVSANQAVQLGVVDFIAASQDELLAKADGRSVDVLGQQIVLQTAGAPVETIDMSFFEQLLQVLSDPNIAYILLSLGSLAIIFEIANPGGIIAAFVELTSTAANKAEILERTRSVLAVNDVSFSVDAGEIFVVMGLSGSGKSTLVRCLSRQREFAPVMPLNEGTDSDEFKTEKT